MNKGIKKSFKRTVKSLGKSLPIIICVIFIIGLVKSFISFKAIKDLFTGITILDTFFGSISGSILAGNVLNSYVIGNELLKAGLSLFAVTAFLVAWVSVGIVQLPAEKKILGAKFTYWRNSLSIIFSIIIGLLTTLTIRLI